MEQINLKEIFSRLNNKKLVAIQDIEATLDTVCAETMLCSQIAQLLITTEQGNIGDLYGMHPAMIERLAEIAIPKFGVSSNKEISVFQSNEIYPLLEDILNADMFSSRQSEDLPSIADDLKSSSEVVRGSAFPEQTAAKIRQIQGKFDAWFEKQVGISPSRAVDITESLVPRIEELYNDEQDNIFKIAKDYGMSGRAMNKLLHDLGVQYKMGDTWLLYQKYANMGYTQSKTHAIDAERSVMHTYWTQKGRLFLYDLLKNKRNLLPMIERTKSA